MFGSDWSHKHFIITNVVGPTFVAALILVFVWGLSARYTEDRVHAERDASSYANSTIDEIERLCSGREGRVRIECETQIIEASRTAQHDAHDLQAQRDSAQWAFWVMAGTGIGLIVSGIGLVALFISLAQTRTAIKDNKLATELEFRPMLMPDWMLMTPHPTTRESLFHGDVHVQLRWKNVGKTPAKMILTEMWTRMMDNTNLVRDISEVQSLIEGSPVKTKDTFDNYIASNDTVLSPAALFIYGHPPIFNIQRRTAGGRVFYTSRAAIVIARATYTFAIGGQESRFVIRNGFTFQPTINDDGVIVEYNILTIGCVLETT
jgi:hypothetical protein